MANDAVFDLAIAFLNSFRCHNPALPLCLLPFDSDIERLRGVAAEYRFSVFCDEAVLAFCDGIGPQFQGHRVGEYRKLAMGWGEFDEFVYFDVDIVVLRSVDFLFKLLEKWDVVTGVSDLPELLPYVWKDSVFFNTPLNNEQIRFAGNVGFLAARKGALEPAVIQEKIGPARQLARHMALQCADQPLLNYLIVTSGKRYSSLLEQWNGGDSSIALEYWAGRAGGTVAGGALWIHEGVVLFVHWAGCWKPTWLDRWRRGDWPSSVRRSLAYRDLWAYYRFLRR